MSPDGRKAFSCGDDKARPSRHTQGSLRVPLGQGYRLEEPRERNLEWILPQLPYTGQLHRRFSFGSLKPQHVQKEAAKMWSIKPKACIISEEAEARRLFLGFGVAGVAAVRKRAGGVQHGLHSRGKDLKSPTAWRDESEQFETLTLCIADSRPSITIGSGLCSSRLETRRLVGIGPVKHSWLHGRSLAVLQRSLRTLHPAWTSEVDVWDYNRSTPLSSFEWGCERVITATCPSF